jgi:hypothetical protein
MSTSVDKLISELEYRLGWADDAAHRLRCLNAINEAELFIAQQGSFLYLSCDRALSLANNTSSVAMPSGPLIDYGKLAVVADDVGVLSYQPADTFYTAPLATFYSLRNTRPAVWRFGRDNSNALAIFFRGATSPANTTGGSLAYTITYQQIPVALTDDAGSFSLLPSGYADTLLLARAEAELRRIMRSIGWEKKASEFSEQLTPFYAGQRTSKEEARTDPEVQQRAQYAAESEA